MSTNAPEPLDAEAAAKRLKAQRRARHDASTALRKLAEWAGDLGHSNLAYRLRCIGDEVADIASTLDNLQRNA
jgi:hypothetical protein